MANRTKILVVDSDLDSLSRIYLALVHRNYKAEASDQQQEIAERVKRLKPAVVILGSEEFRSLKQDLKMPAIVLMNKEEMKEFPGREDLVPLEKHVQIDALIRTIETLVI
jgi:DNA-binding response OmpR family regulator